MTMTSERFSRIVFSCVFLSAALGGCGHSQSSVNRYPYPSTANLPVARSGAVSLEIVDAIGADVRVTSWNSQLASISLRRTDDLDAHVDLHTSSDADVDTFRVDISPDARLSFVDWATMQRPQVSIDLRVPRTVGLTVAMSNGSLVIGNVVGPIRTNIENGAIEIDGAGSVISAHSRNGSILAGVAVVNAVPDIRLSLTDGPIELDVPASFHSGVKTHHLFGPVDIAPNVEPGQGSIFMSSVAGPIDIARNQ
jgi:hypothetical protein